MTARRLCAVLAGALVVVLAGCGIDGQHHAQRIPTGDVPFGLLSPAAPSPGGNGAPADDAVILYLLDKGRLVAVARELPAPATVDALLHALAAGPTTSEATNGLTSAVSAPGSALTGVVAGDHVTINLTAQFGRLATREQVDALAQLVYTATAIPGVEAVRFRIGGKRVAVPRGNNTTTTAPVTRADYRSLAPVVPAP